MLPLTSSEIVAGNLKSYPLMESGLPLVDESSSTRAGRLPRNTFISHFKRRWDAMCSYLTSVMEFIQFGNGLAPEPMPSHLKIGNAIEMIEDGGLTFVKATIENICRGNGMLLVKSSCDGSDNFILLQKDKVRPVQATSVSLEHHGRGPHPSFTLYDLVDVLISGKWMTGVIIQSPTSNEDSYHVRIFREKQKSDLTVTVTTKVRLHFDWDRLRGWNHHGNVPNNHPSNQAVGLVGYHRAKIVKMLDVNHAVVQYSDLANPDGTNVEEVIHIKDWYKSKWARCWKELRYWLAPSNDPVQEFECYMPVYSCLAMLSAVSQVLFANSAENWPDNMLLYFYGLGGLCCFLSTSLVVGVMCCEPTTRGVLRIWRVLCLICVAIGVSFLAIHAMYGRQAVMASRVKKPSVTSDGQSLA